MSVRQAVLHCVLAAVVLAAGCLPSGNVRTPRMSDDALIFSQAQQALDAHDYPDAAGLLQLFLREFPDSKRYTWGLQRMGETMEGLLSSRYLRPIENGQDASSVRAAFLAAHGSYGCWKTDAALLRYDGSHYRRLLEKFPDSDIADEAAYRLVVLDSEPQGSPGKVEQEIAALELVLERYPTTTLRHEILFEMACRCHRLYELYAYSGQPVAVRRERAKHYREKAVYLYTLTLKSPQHSLLSEKAWSNLQDIEDGRRIFP